MTAAALDRVVPGPARLPARRQRARAVGQQRTAAARRGRPGGSRLERRRHRAAARRRAQGPAPRGVPLGGAGAAAVHRRAEGRGAAALPAGDRGALRHDAHARGGRAPVGDGPRRLPAARGRRRAHGAVLPRGDARPRPAGGRADRGGGGGAGPLHGPAGPRRRRQALRRRRRSRRTPATWPSRTRTGPASAARPSGRAERLVEASRGRRRGRLPAALPRHRRRRRLAGAGRGGGRQGAPRAGRPRTVAGADIVTHLQLVDPRDYARMAALGVVAAVQPYWFTKDPDYHRELLPVSSARAPTASTP